ncbi:hypothetical protein FB45DRAFT_681223, partial [Roridomyces roridus]
MEMPLPHGVPTLCAKGTGNLTRPDNVFCSKDFLDYFVSCNAYPERTPGKTDHFPIVMEADLVPPKRVVEERRDWRRTDWKEFGKMLAEELEGIPEAEGYGGAEEVVAAVEALDAVVWRCVGKHVPLSKISPHSKRWWNGELKAQKDAKQKLAQLSFSHRDIPDSPAHEQFRRARNDYSAALKRARDSCWMEYMEEIEEADVFTIGKMVKGEPGD